MKILFSIAALLGCLAVILGAWSSHAGLRILSPEQIALMQKGLRYQMHHALALFAVCWAIAQWPQAATALTVAGGLLVAGVIFFSGSLYLLAFNLFNPGYLTPVGGTLLIAGWLWLAIAVWRG